MACSGRSRSPLSRWSMIQWVWWAVPGDQSLEQAWNQRSGGSPKVRPRWARGAPWFSSATNVARALSASRFDQGDGAGGIALAPGELVPAAKRPQLDSVPPLTPVPATAAPRSRRSALSLRGSDRRAGGVAPGVAGKTGRAGRPSRIFLTAPCWSGDGIRTRDPHLGKAFRSHGVACVNGRMCSWSPVFVIA